jgi:hypothetical protein
LGRTSEIIDIYQSLPAKIKIALFGQKIMVKPDNRNHWKNMDCQSICSNGSFGFGELGKQGQVCISIGNEKKSSKGFCRL